MSSSSPNHPATPSLSGLSGLGDRIAALAERAGGKRKLSNAAGIRESQLFRYIRGDNTPSLSAAAALAQAGGVSLEWLAYGERPNAAGRILGIQERIADYGSGDEWIAAPFHRDTEPPLLFRSGWLEELGLSPDSLLLAQAPDDAMLPTVQPNDLLLADTRAQEAASAGLYLFLLQEIPVPRRAVPTPDGALRLHCDNSVYPELVLDERERAELRVLGTIVWAGRRL